MIYLASDHGGWRVKQRLASWLSANGYTVHDLGPRHHRVDDDYPLWAKRLARAVARDPQARGLAICRSGVGMAMVTNKFSGIRAAQAFSPTMARQSRRDEDTNILSLAADYHSWTSLQSIVTAWLKTPYRPT